MAKPLLTSAANPVWVQEVKKEIKRLKRRITAMQKTIDDGEGRSESWEDIDNWTGWMHGLQWCLKMRDGTATRKDAWGGKE